MVSSWGLLVGFNWEHNPPPVQVNITWELILVLLRAVLLAEEVVVYNWELGLGLA